MANRCVRWIVRVLDTGRIGWPCERNQALSRMRNGTRRVRSSRMPQFEQVQVPWMSMHETGKPFMDKLVVRAFERLFAAPEPTGEVAFLCLGSDQLCWWCLACMSPTVRYDAGCASLCR